MKIYTYTTCAYVATTMQLHRQQCNNMAIDVLTNHQWTCGNFTIILIFNIFINLIQIIQLKANKMLTHGVICLVAKQVIVDGCSVDCIQKKVIMQQITF